MNASPKATFSLNRAGWGQWLAVFFYAIAMAWVESAVVVYLRIPTGNFEALQRNVLPLASPVMLAEPVREAATLIMLLTVGWMAGKTWRSRLGYTLLAFGVWDIFYYVFLKVLTGWPYSLLDWDILFLLPLPWWGPVLAPVLIASLMIIWGTIASQFERPTRSWRDELKPLLWLMPGISLALYIFMADALRVLDQGKQAIIDVLPTTFNWQLFLLALLMMGVPVFKELRERGGFRMMAVRLGVTREPDA